MIEVNNLSLTMGDKKIIEKITFSIPDKKVIGFLGVNGAGKTTTLDMLSACLKYSHGSIKYDGIELKDNEKEVLKTIGYLPDEPPLYDELKIDEYLKFAGGLRSLSGKVLVTRVNEVLDQFDLNEVRNTIIGKLSKGFRQRVALAAALIHKPKYIFLDEPTEGLDPSQIRKIRQLIDELKDDHTVFISSHILSEIETVCDELIIIDSGKIVDKGEIETIKNKMSSSEIYEMTLEGNTSTILDIIDLNRHVEIIENNKPYYKFRVTDPNFIKNELLKDLISKDISIESFGKSTKSIESLFFNIIEKGEHNAKNF